MSSSSTSLLLLSDWEGNNLLFLVQQKYIMLLKSNAEEAELVCMKQL